MIPLILEYWRAHSWWWCVEERILCFERQAMKVWDCDRDEVRFASWHSHWHPEGIFLCVLQESAPWQIDEAEGRKENGWERRSEWRWIVACESLGKKRTPSIERILHSKYETYVSSFQYYFPVKSYSLIPAKSGHNGNYCAGLNLQLRPSFQVSHSKDKDLKH